MLDYKSLGENKMRSNSVLARSENEHFFLRGSGGEKFKASGTELDQDQG